MKIQILGSGCPKCAELEGNARKAAVELDLNASVEKVTDTETIMAMGVMITPALAVDGQVKSSGKVLSAEQIKGILAGE
jgi:small redox-active disulfide protein 2